MSSRNRAASGVVYSSEFGRMCPKCGRPKNRCSCNGSSIADARTGDGVVRIQLDRKGRKGKGVTVITGVPLDGDELKKLAKALKQKCGTGGTVKAGTIEIQGDHRDLLIQLLGERGYTVKRVGG